MRLPEGAAIVVLGPSALPVARRLRAVLPGSAIHGAAARFGDTDADVYFEAITDHLAALFVRGVPIVALCAAGIVVRALGPSLADKRAEPPVLVVSEDGASVVPLLGGHHGANDLARAIARELDGHPAITTAGELRFGVALDDPPPGWQVANTEAVKPVTAALLAGEAVAIELEISDGGWLDQVPRVSSTLGWSGHGIRVTYRNVAEAPLPGVTLVVHPPVLALGVGCERNTDPAELSALVHAGLAESGLAASAIAAVVSIDLKSDEAAVHALAGELGVPARFLPAATLLAETDRLANPSAAVFRETGCWGVAEGAALAAIGPAGRLLVPKRKSARATMAVGLAVEPLDAQAIGQGRGRLAIIGIGPGDAAWRTPEATTLLAGVDHLVGYGLYLDLLGSLAAGKARHETGLGHEEDRARHALELAAAGQSVALVSSGDAGIYGLATLVFELLEREARPAWRRVALTVAPGLSALQAAASRAGAPLGHDFCAISLSDLLTPWPIIERRLKAAAEGDFVVALYNPRSERRSTQLEAARHIFLCHRPPETPTLLARNLGRPGETIRTVRLADLSPADVDMLTLVMIGSSATRVVPGTDWIYTPRGYGAKANRS
jgi:cobalt-precorrin 5A hydrolase/precorrin-3B C17-methyltransferase